MLIWSSLKEFARTYLRSGQIYAFITDNYKDFCDEIPSEQGWYYLHADLLDELMEENNKEFPLFHFERDTIRVYRSISSLNNDILHEKSELFTNIINKLNNERYRELLDYISKELSKIIELENNDSQNSTKELLGLNYVKPRDVYKTWTDSFDDLSAIIDIKYTINVRNDASNQISMSEGEIVLYINSEDGKFEVLYISRLKMEEI